MTALARNPWLILAAILDGAAAVAHLGCIVGGASLYRALGAGERMARMAAAGKPRPAVFALLIGGALVVVASAALSGAGVVPRVPGARWVLVLATIVFVGRGLVLFHPALLRRPDLSATFLFWSSVIVLAYGVIHALGTWHAWPDLTGNH